MIHAFASNVPILHGISFTVVAFDLNRHSAQWYMYVMVPKNLMLADVNFQEHFGLSLFIMLVVN